jgi:soluble lytic murein transglycosylase-like protein
MSMGPADMRSIVIIAAVMGLASLGSAGPLRAAPDVDASSPVGAADQPPKNFDANAVEGSMSSYRQIIAREAAREGLPAAIAEAVTAVESGFNPLALGSSGEIGLMQLMPSTARLLGFTGGNAELAQPETNIRLGVSYLARAWRLAHGDICTATMKYRAGHGETRFSTLSVNYCLAVRAKLASGGYPLTGTVPVASFGDAAALGAARHGCRRCFSGGQIGTVDIAAINANLAAVVAQARAGK